MKEFSNPSSRWEKGTTWIPQLQLDLTPPRAYPYQELPGHTTLVTASDCQWLQFVKVRQGHADRVSMYLCYLHYVLGGNLVWVKWDEIGWKSISWAQKLNEIDLHRYGALGLADVLFRYCSNSLTKQLPVRGCGTLRRFLQLQDFKMLLTASRNFTLSFAWLLTLVELVKTRQSQRLQVVLEPQLQQLQQLRALCLSNLLVPALQGLWVSCHVSYPLVLRD